MSAEIAKLPFKRGHRPTPVGAYSKGTVFVIFRRSQANCFFFFRNEKLFKYFVFLKNGFPNLNFFQTL